MWYINQSRCIQIWGIYCGTNMNNNTLENHEQITLNTDDDIGSQIPVIWQCLSITIPLAIIQVHLCKMYACFRLLFTSFRCICMHFNEKLLCHHSPRDDYRFLNFVPIVINLYTFR